MAFPPGQAGSPIPAWLNSGTGVASAPLLLGLVTREALTPVHYFGMPLLVVTGNNQTVWEAAFFKLLPSDTSQRGDLPIAVLWVTRESLTRQQGYANRDYALRKVCDDWFLGASSTFGRPVERSRLQQTTADIGGVLGWGSFPVLHDRVTRESLTPNHAWANDDTTLRTKMLDWFLGRTAGSADVHILYRLGRYP